MDSPRGRENNAWPGHELSTKLDVVRGFSLVQNREHDPEGSHYIIRTKGQPDNEAGLKFGFTEEKCFQ